MLEKLIEELLAEEEFEEMLGNEKLHVENHFEEVKGE